MPRRRRGNTLERWEIALVKAMLERGGYNDQDILAYFTRPTRSVNHRVIAEIRTESKHKAVKAASQETLEEFLAGWPAVDHQTGLSLSGDELLIKAREAMIAAVNTFNSAGLYFRAELFIVTAVIAWTYLLHAFYRRKGVDYRYYKTVKGNREVEKTKCGAEKYWDLGRCLRDSKCPVSEAVKKNLEFLMELRHEIEHRSTSRIDETVAAELQACCINFNDTLKELFGSQHGLEKRLPIALQFVSFGADQRALLKRATDLPQHVATFINAFEHGLSEEEFSDPAYRMRIAFVPIASNRASSADKAFQFVKPDSDEARAISDIFLKEVNKRRYTATQVIERAKAEGYPNFSQHNHTTLWKQLEAKDPNKGYGCEGDYKNTWVWFDNWIARVLEHCKENAERYQ